MAPLLICRKYREQENKLNLHHKHAVSKTGLGESQQVKDQVLQQINSKGKA